MVASAKLSSLGYQVIGVDLCYPALKAAQNYNLNENLVCANVSELSLSDPEGKIGIVFPLDILEHLTQAEAINVLTHLHKHLPSAHLFASMPSKSASIISSNPVP